MVKINVQTNLEKVVNIFTPPTSLRAAYIMSNQMLADMTRYVPRRDGFLQMSGHVSTDRQYLVWRTPYAKAQFYGSNGKVEFRNYTTPGTGKRWDLAAKGNHLESWARVYQKAMGL